MSWRAAEEHALDAVALGQACKPPEPPLEASPLTTLGDIASAMCRFPKAKERWAGSASLLCMLYHQLIVQFFGNIASGMCSFLKTKER